MEPTRRRRSNPCHRRASPPATVESVVSLRAIEALPSSQRATRLSPCPSASQLCSRRAAGHHRRSPRRPLPELQAAHALAAPPRLHPCSLGMHLWLRAVVLLQIATISLRLAADRVGPTCLPPATGSSSCRRCLLSMRPSCPSKLHHHQSKQSELLKFTRSKQSESTESSEELEA